MPENAARHRAAVHARNARVIEENRHLLLEYLLKHPCVDCGESDPLVLEFDHVRGVKKANIPGS